MSGVFRRLTRGHGGYSLPYLIELSDRDGRMVMRYINDVKDCVHDGKVYAAGAFKYTPNASEHGFDGGGSLEIAVRGAGNRVIDLVETYRDIRLSVVGCLMQDGSVTEVRAFRHRYGTVKVDREKATFTFNRDDRLGMTFPALTWNAYNNRGNA